MNYNQYKQLFEEILNHPNPASPYDDEMYLNYTKLNRTRMRRWDKQLDLDDNLIACLKQISQPQHWIIITEPWCGDAAHIIPFLTKMAELNEFISYDIQLRDSPPSLIENYLTKGSKSIPKLIVRDDKANDLFVWGPRPKEAQRLINILKAINIDPETTKTALQNWYNDDKGKSLYTEIIDRFNENKIIQCNQPNEELSSEAA